MTASTSEHTSTLRSYLRVLQRRKRVVIAAALVLPLAAAGYSLQQQQLYEASAQVLLSDQNLAATLTGTQQTGITQDPVRIAQTQADVARVPALATQVLAHVRGTGLTPRAFIGSSSVSASSNSDILTFAVTNPDPALARKLVDAYASAYTVYRRQLDTSAIVRARSSVEQRIAQLKTAGDGHSTLYASLVDRDQTLATMEALQTSNASVIQNADGVAKVQPRTTRNVALAIVLGIVFGIAIAFLWEALDTRVRTAEDIAQRLGRLPLLARIPEPSKALRARNRLEMIDHPRGPHAEAFRVLRTNLDFASIDREARTLMVTSAVESEGKSTTIANLAVALARAGKSVVLVDLDLHRPYLHKFFDVSGPGLTQVALGHVSLEQALALIAITNHHHENAGVKANESGNGNGHGNSHGNGRRTSVGGVLELLPAGPTPPDPGEFVGTHRVSEILAQLRDRADFVLVDAPPVLQVGDAITLSTKVDGILIVARSGVIRRHLLDELHRQIQAIPTPVLGFVVTGANEEEAYGYGYENSYAYSYEDTLAVPVIGASSGQRGTHVGSGR